MDASTQPGRKGEKTWEQMSRNEKRACKLKLPSGKAVPAMELIRIMAKSLPAAVQSGTALTIDHEKQLRKAFMINGADGVNYYVKKITGLYAEKHKALVEENAKLMAEDKKKLDGADNS